MDEGVVGHRGNTVISAGEIKALHAVSTTHVITASWFCLQSPLERKWDWHGLGQLVFLVCMEYIVWKLEGVGECLDTGSFMGGLWLAERKSGSLPHYVLLPSACAGSRREHRHCLSSGGCSVACCEVRMQEGG